MGRSQRMSVAVPLAAVLAILLWVLSGPLAAARADEAVTRSYSESGVGSFVVPAGVTQLGVRAIGGRGAAHGVESRAAEAEGELSVTPGEQLYVVVAGNGEGVEGGFNGGGDGGGSRRDGAGGGGGASDVRTAPYSAGLSPDTRLIVAGGGGGEGSTGDGGAAGAAGAGSVHAPPGQAGSQTAGGEAGTGTECFEFRAETTVEASTSGSLGQGGAGELCFTKFSGTAVGGGGGGGYYGGGGGGAYLEPVEEGASDSEGAGGGGGSSLVPEGGTVRLAGEEAEPEVAFSFIEPENPPLVATSPAVAVRSTSAQLEGEVNPEEREITSCVFEWGTSSEYGHSIPCAHSPGAGGFAVRAGASLEGLAPATAYHYRLVAANDRGTSYGQDVEFVTLAHEKPVLTGFSPASGPQAGGTAIAIAGTELQYVTQVLLGQRSVAFQHVSPAELTTVAPADACGGCYEPLEAVDDLGDRIPYIGTGFRSLPAPVVTSLSVKKGPAGGGTQIVVTGDWLKETSEVLLGSTPATVEARTDTSLTVRTTASPAGKYDVLAVTPGGESAASKKAVFDFEGPVVTGVTPSSGPRAGGTTVTVTGSGFAPGAGTTRFTFATAAASGVECASTTQCTMTAPASTKPRTVDVRAAFGKKSKKSAADRFTYE